MMNIKGLRPVFDLKRDEMQRWSELLKFAPGFEPESFDDFSKGRRELIKQLGIAGIVAVEKTLNIDDYIRWVDSKGLPRTGDYREAFAWSLFLKELKSAGIYALLPPEKS